MKYFYLEPEAVSLSSGENTVMDTRFHPPIVSRFHCVFDVWLGDALVEDNPCWLATASAAKSILAADLTGVSTDTVEVTPSEFFHEICPGRELPEFTWLKVHGKPGVDDFGVNKSVRIVGNEGPVDPRTYTLVVSERALKLLLRLGIKHATCSKYPP
jgi:hypothetical protein